MEKHPIPVGSSENPISLIGDSPGRFRKLRMIDKPIHLSPKKLELKVESPDVFIIGYKKLDAQPVINLSAVENEESSSNSAESTLLASCFAVAFGLPLNEICTVMTQESNNLRRVRKKLLARVFKNALKDL